MKSCQKPTTVLSQDTAPIFHNGYHINHPEFDFEDATYHRLNKIRGVAGLFFAEFAQEGRNLSEPECNGIHSILKDAVNEIEFICDYMATNQEVGHADA